jgi:large subunit ribosomal protein L19
MKAKNLTKETINSLGIRETNYPNFEIGDTIAVATKIVEGGKERTQVFQGDVIAMHKKGASSTFIVRKIGANSVAVERIFPYYSPKIDSINVIKKGKVRRAKLFYLRDRVGKAGRVKERLVKKVKVAKEDVPFVAKKSIKEPIAEVK